MKILLKFIPLRDIVKFAWQIIDPVLEKKIKDSESSIDDKVYLELKIIILKIINGL